MQASHDRVVLRLFQLECYHDDSDVIAVHSRSEPPRGDFRRPIIHSLTTEAGMQMRLLYRALISPTYLFPATLPTGGAADSPGTILTIAVTIL